MSSERKTISPTVQHIIAGTLVALALVLLFHFYGNLSMQGKQGPSAFLWIYRSWVAARGDFSHGWMMPLISLFIVWQRRKDLLEVSKQRSVAGLVLTVLCLTLHVAAYRAQHPRISLIAFAGLTWTIPLYLYGSSVAKKLLFPCGYLCLCLLTYYLVALSFPFRLMASVGASFLINGIGIEAVRTGTIIQTSAEGGFVMEVADACSGLRSLAVTAALAAPYALYTQKTFVKQWALFLLCLPIAMIANTLRIVTVAIVAQWGSTDAALKVYHDYSGYVVFIAVVGLMMAFGGIINLDYKGLFKKWKEDLSKPTSSSSS